MRVPARRAALGAMLLLAGCRLAGPRPAEREPRPFDRPLPTEEPQIRVGLAVNASEAALGAQRAGYDLIVDDDVVAEAGAGEGWTVTARDGGVVAERGDGRRLGPFDSPVRVRPREGGAVEVGGQPYRGTVLVRSGTEGGVTVVNVVALEAYLLGVVPREIPAVDLDAVKAQAIAARTYAIRNMGRRGSMGFDVFGSVQDQAYGGLAEEHPVTSRAVRETRGEVLVYEGAPIQAYYHSTCGGRTAAIEEIWRRDPVPYLRSVSDRIPGTNEYYCQASNRFRWTERWTGPGLAAILEGSLAEYLAREVEPIAAVRGLEVTERTRSERAEVLRVRTRDGEYRVRGDSIRWVLRPEPDRILNSTLFELDVERGDDRVREVVAEGGGWGHGVGMCQWGAIGRAERGQSYRRILAHYYPGTELRRLY